jgi:xylulokinase
MSRQEPAFVVGIDLGTSSCKVGIFDPGGEPHGFGQAAYPIVRGPAGLAEQSPSDWWQSVCQAARQALQGGRVPGEAVAAVGLSGQVGTHVLLDRDGQPLRPALSWQDTRAGPLAPTGGSSSAWRIGCGCCSWTAGTCGGA